MKSIIQLISLTLFSILFSFIICELAFRAYSGQTVFQLVDYQHENAIPIDVEGAAAYDKILGWRMRSNFKSEMMNTIEFGIRRNYEKHNKVRQGAIMVVGASFAAGSEVRDEEAFPAYLEKLTGMPVENVASGGYSMDQITLRAEEMLPHIKPSIVIVDIAFDNIVASKYSINGRPKPYFKISEGKLNLYNVPVPKDVTLEQRSIVHNFFNYLLVYDRTIATFFPEKYLITPSIIGIREVDVDTVDLACLLFERMKKQMDPMGIKLGVNWQYGSGYVPFMPPVPREASEVQECLTKMGIPYADELKRMRQLHDAKNGSYEGQYMNHPGGILGHKSPKGNLDVAYDVIELLERMTNKKIPINAID